MNKSALDRELEVDSMNFDVERDLTTQVDTLRVNSGDQLDERYGFGQWLYVGRGQAVYGRRWFNRSPLANAKYPSLKPGSTIPDYKRWLWGCIKTHDKAVVRELMNVPHYRALVCHCAKDAEFCHAHIIIAAAEWLASDAGTPYRIA